MILSILKNLQKELSIFLIIIAVSTAIIVISQSWWQSAIEDKQNATNMLDLAKHKYYTALDRKRLLKEFEDKYNQLKSVGIVGDEQRLNWVDVMEKITTEFKIPYLKYRIEKRQTVSSVNIQQKYPGISLYKSPMTLEMQLLHEGDLYTVINNLDKKARGLFDVQSCIISRNFSQTESILDSGIDRNFSAICKLNWYTIQKKAVALPERRSS